MDEKLLQMSVTIHSNPGVYALFLGSGISYPAKIPTGWQLMQKLILKIAAVHGESPENPIEWYKEKFSDSPRYDEVIQKLGSTSADRNAILRPEFELQGDEGENDPELKRPTKAHRAIASLIKRGYFKVVLTTNFDRLLEQALEAEGVTPNVVSTDSALEGARPPQHSRITIYKIHGDYLDDDFRNIDSELGEYPEIWKSHLDRILDEYGLIICGWSAEWDKALRQRFEAAKSRRYTTFWSAYPEASETTQILIRHRDAKLIEEKSADELFTELDANISALEQFNRPSPISVAVAVERVKRLIPNESKYIELEDFVKHEVIEAYNRFRDQDFEIIKEIVSINSIKDDFYRYFYTSEIPLNILVALANYGKHSQRSLMRFSIEHWMNNVYPELHNNKLIPCLLFLYSASIVTLYKENWSYLPSIIIEPQTSYQYDDYHQNELVLVRLILRFFDHAPDYKQIYGIQIKELVRILVKPYIVNQKQFNDMFDLLEMIFSLVLTDQGGTNRIWFFLNQDPLTFHAYSYDFLHNYWLHAGQLSENWGLLKSGGLFGGSTDRLHELLKMYDDYLEKNFYAYKGNVSRQRPKYAVTYKRGLGN